MIGRDVRVSMVAVAQGNLTVTISETPKSVSQRHSRAAAGPRVVPRTSIGVQEDGKKMFAGQGRRVPATGRRWPQRHGHRAARSDHYPASDQGRGRDPGRHRGDVMASASPCPPPAQAARLLLTNSTAAGKLRHGQSARRARRHRILKPCSSIPCSSTCSPASAAKARSAAVARPGSGARCSRTNTAKSFAKVGRHRDCRSGLSHTDGASRGTVMTSPSARIRLPTQAKPRRRSPASKSVMDRLEQTVAEETARVRAGRLRDAAELDDAKIEFARLYICESERVKAARSAIAQPGARRARTPAPAARLVPTAAANKSDCPGDRPCRLGRHHPRRVGRTRAQAGAFDLRCLRPRADAEQQNKSATGNQPYVLVRSSH